MKLIPFLCLSAMVILAGCANEQAKQETVPTGEVPNLLQQTDIEFSDYSNKHGMKAAFLKYMDSSAVMLRPGHMPYEKDSAFALIKGMVDSTFVLTWGPMRTIVSGELGYTYGTWSSRGKNQPVESAERGTYVTIWRKQADGSWKFVLDTGNPGLSPQK